MSQAAALRMAIQSRELPHAYFEEHMNELHMRIQDALEGNPPSCDMVVGPSRVGKSMLADALVRNYPESAKDGIRQVPVLKVRTPSPASPRVLPRSVLVALKAPVPASMASTALMYERMARQLKTAGTRVILFDEASQIVDVGTRMSPRAAGDWFKQLLDALDISVVLLGVPRLESLLKSNEQLRLRSGAVMRFNPYSWEDIAERRQFVACTRAYVTMFEETGSRFLFDHEALVRNTYLLSGGLIGIVTKFMARLAFDIKSRENRDISFEDCAAAASRIEAASNEDFPAFSAETIADVNMNASHIFVLEESRADTRKTRGGAKK
ncbi:TniB family NTP-binding protein [Hydrogenophaga palleronii]|uniref:TniB family NTP-binding protein n=1 Tax=Hydrogenophaga palleronii TaxID=65655 RepID=UPI0009FD40AE|nr:TniB family NTP-binding protein [Hydrogenophaga palleronii]